LIDYCLSFYAVFGKASAGINWVIDLWGES
jgi:hypothetical protein